ncbi:MAG TPA: Ig-like domain-containing protein, partial [Pyrinomonadaceae bacterium]
PLFSSLSSPTIDGNTASVTLSGKLTLGALVPTGSVAITLNSVTQNAAIQPNGSFSSNFSTASLMPANSPYAVTFSYAGDGNFNPASAGSTLTIKAPRKVKQDVLAALMVLRAAATDKKDKDELDDAIDHLNKALNPEFWVDDSHPTEKDGEKVFNEEKTVVKELAELIKSKTSMNPTDAALMDLITRLVQVDRELALISISEETDPNKVAKAMDEIAKGDADRDTDKPDHADNAINHYKNAWKKT